MPNHHYLVVHHNKHQSRQCLSMANCGKIYGRPNFLAYSKNGVWPKNLSKKCQNKDLWSTSHLTSSMLVKLSTLPPFKYPLMPSKAMTSNQFLSHFCVLNCHTRSNFWLNFIKIMNKRFGDLKNGHICGLPPWAAVQLSDFSCITISDRKMKKKDLLFHSCKLGFLELGI